MAKKTHSNLHLVSWLLCALHTVYQLRNREQVVAPSAEEFIALAAPVFLHVHEAEDVVEL